MLGKATDFYIPGVPLEQLRAVGLYLQRGGVGFYPSSGSPFVHLDTGNVRHWPGIADGEMPRWMNKGKDLVAANESHPGNNKVVVASATTSRKVESPAPAAAAPAHVEPARPVQLAAAEKPVPVTLADKPVPVPASRPAAKPAVLDKPAVAAAEPAKPAPAAAAPAASFELASVSSKPVKLADLNTPPARPAQAASLVASPTPAPTTAPGAAAPGSASDIIGARGFWHGLPEAPDTTPARPAAPARAAAAAKRPAATTVASADPESTASLPPLLRNERDTAGQGTVGALAYAAPADAPLATRPAPMGANLGRSAQPDTSIAVKRNVDRPAAAPAGSVPLGNPNMALKAGDRVNDPWLRAMIIAPSLNLMSTSMLSKPDYRNLTPFMQKPASTVMMTFSDDPYVGMGSDKFGGSAVVFVSTTTFGKARTASLR
jgi:hypothetical protein